MSLLHSCSLFLWLHARIPKGYDIDSVANGAIHHLVHPVDDEATVGLWAFGEKWVNEADIRTLLDKIFHILYPLQELLSCFATKLCIDIACYLAV